jgi:L-ascorbate metabolism protein UlaG (beta-lactamase superfamily)
MRLIGEQSVSRASDRGHFTMDPSDAAMAAELLGVGHVIPIHYGTFPILTGTPDQLRSALAARGLGAVEVHAPEPGGTVR